MALLTRPIRKNGFPSLLLWSNIREVRDLISLIYLPVLDINIILTFV